MILAPRAQPIYDKRSLKFVLAHQRKSGALRKLNKAPRLHAPVQVEAAYFLAILDSLRDLRKLIDERLIRKLPAIIAEAPRDLRGDAVRFDDFDTALERATSSIKIDYLQKARPDVRKAAREAALAVSTAQNKDHKRSFEAVLGVRPDLQEPWLADVITSFTRQNVRLIEDLSEAVLDVAERHVSDGVRQGLTIDEITDQIEADAELEGESITRSKAALIASDQVTSLYGDLARVRQQKIGIKRYIWRTSKDERVRASHNEREGEVFTWSTIEPQLEEKGLTVDKIDGHPGRPVRCRCYPEPVFEDLLEGAPEIDAAA